MKKVFILLILSFFIFSCDKEETILNPNADENSGLVIDYDYESKLKLDFAKALALAMNESVPLREFIKDEALKMFDKDYEVLYYLVKDDKLSDGQSFRDVLLSFYEDENRLSEIENTNPLLTILVPELPEDSFSANIWNPQNDIPFVAIRMNTTNHVPIVSNEGEVRVLQGGMIPAFPIVVIKDNERLVVSTGIISKNSANGGVIKSKNGELEFRFLNDSFNGALTNNSNTKAYYHLRINPKLKEAYDIYKNIDGWQRDYIYYDLTPNNRKGEFKYDYKECLTHFSFKQSGITPWDLYNKLSDQKETSDPSVAQFMLNANTSSWTGGRYEFIADFVLNSRAGVGETISFGFSIHPSRIFEAKYKKIKVGWFNIYKFESLEFKNEFNLLTEVEPIFKWDLNTYGTSILVDFYEVDYPEIFISEESRSVKFANNFKIDISGGGGEDAVLKKIDLKFGSSLETEVLVKTTRKITKGNDHLGTTIIDFADDVVTHEFPIFSNYKIWRTSFYRTNYIIFSLDPLHVSEIQ